jgi:hypothetical protein
MDTFLVERGNDVYVISFRPANIPGVKVHHIRALLGKVGCLLAARQISQLIYHISPDLLHAHHVTSYGLVGALSGYHPYLISSWGSDVIWSPHQLFLLDWMLRYNFKQAELGVLFELDKSNVSRNIKSILTTNAG